MSRTPIKHSDSAAPAKPIPVGGNANSPKADEYLSSVSKKYRFAKYITVLCLVVFLLFSFTFMRNDITLENLRYLLKFISFTNTETSITASKINYATGDPNRLELFIGDLCTLSPSGYALYDSYGNQIMSERINYASPVLKVSEHFALCYDLDGNEYTVLNTFTKLSGGITEYPITDACIADDGSFAIASSSREYRTAITLYNSDFEAISKIYKNDHLMALEFKADASEVAIMTAYAESGRFYTKIELVAPGADKAHAVCVLDGLGYSMYYMDEAIAVITDGGICMLNNSLDLVSMSKHPSQLALSDASRKYLCVMYSSGVIGNSYTARIFDKAGRIVFEDEFSGKLIGVDSDDSGDYIFFLTGSTLSRINLINKKIGVQTVESGAIDILVSDPNTVLVAKTNYAQTYELSNLEERYFNKDSETSNDNEQ